MEVSALASGSSGNCFYIGNKDYAILIDAGISAKQIELRLSEIGKSTKNIKGIFITHEHSDHTRGADVFARNLNIPIFATKKTAENCFLCSNSSLISHIKNNEAVNLAGMNIKAFPKSHSAADPVSYTISKEKKVSVITDIGCSCKNVISHVSDSDFLFLESNHDENMLLTGPYPPHLKAWIKSDLGHLSNRQASLCVLEYAHKKLKNIVLSHLSKTNNTPQIALKTFNSLMKERPDIKPQVAVSNREEPTPLIKI